VSYFWIGLFLGAGPASDHKSGQQGGNENACPEAGLGGNVADVLATDEVVSNPPGQRPEGQKGQQKRREDDGAGAAAAGFLILHDAE